MGAATSEVAKIKMAGFLKSRNLDACSIAMLLVGSAMPTLAQVGEAPVSQCVWEWNRYLCRTYRIIATVAMRDCR